MATSIHLHIVCDCSQATTAEVSDCDRAQVVHRAKNMYHWTLCGETVQMLGFNRRTVISPCGERLWLQLLPTSLPLLYTLDYISWLLTGLYAGGKDKLQSMWTGPPSETGISDSSVAEVVSALWWPQGPCANQALEKSVG